MKQQHPGLVIQQAFDSINLRPPLVFSIPRMYEDDYPRNDKWYMHLKKIEKETKKIKDELLQIKERHHNLYEKTSQIVAATRDRRNRVVNKTWAITSHFHLNHPGDA